MLMLEFGLLLHLSMWMYFFVAYFIVNRVTDCYEIIWFNTSSEYGFGAQHTNFLVSPLLSHLVSHFTVLPRTLHHHLHHVLKQHLHPYTEELGFHLHNVPSQYMLSTKSVALWKNCSQNKCKA